MRKLMLLGVVMMFLLSISALADVCSSTNQLLEGEVQTYTFCTESEVISKGDIFSLGGVEWQYKGADKVTEESPKIKFKNLETGDSVTLNVNVANNKATFMLNGYAFESVSDVNVMDYTIKLTSGKVSSCATYEIVPVLIDYDQNLDERYVNFEINGEKTSKLDEGDSYILANGAVLSVNEILYQAYAGGIHAVWFCIDGEEGEIQAGNVVDEVEISPVSMEADLSNYPELFFKSDVFNAYFVVGWEAPSIDNLAMTDIAVGLEDNDYKIENAAKLDSEISNPLNKNLIVVGRPSENIIAKLLLGTGSFLSPGEGMIKLFENNGYVQMLVTGYSAEDTRKATKVLQNYDDYNLEGKEIIVTGSMSNPQIQKSAQPIVVEPEEPQAEEPQPQPEPTPQVEVPQKAECVSGCQANGNCLPYGTRLLKDGEQVYCNIDGTLQEQQVLNAACQNNYECSSNQCSNGSCVDLQQLSGKLEETNSLLAKILAWIEKIFS